MTKLYNILAKRATFWIVVIFLLSPTPILAKVPNDSMYFEQQQMWRQISAPTAWDYGTGSRQVVVAIIDTGADTWHDDLRANIWINQGEIADNHIDDDHNGYIDDVNGWDFVEESNEVRTSVFNNSDDPEAVRHGTIIAGLIGAVGGNEQGTVGLNWSVRLMPLRAIDSSGSGSFESVVAAINYAVDNGAQVISMSFVGVDRVEILRAAMRRAYDKGVVVVAAAGNHSRDVSGNLDLFPKYPACFDQGDNVNWLLTVASVNSSDKLSRFSNYGECIDIAAPGENIFSTERYAPQFGYQNKFGGHWQGTSFAAPLVAGAAALVKSQHPDWRPDKIISLLLNTADSIDDINPNYFGKIGNGRLNIGRAIASAAKSEPSRGILNNDIYYHDRHEIWRYSASDLTTFIADITKGEILSVAPFAFDDSGDIKLAVLFKQGKTYLTRVLSPTGNAIGKDIALPIPSKNRVVKKIQSFQYADGKNIFIVEQFDTRAKKTFFTKLDEQGKKMMEFSTVGVVSAWLPTPTNAGIFAIKQNGNAIVVEQKFFDVVDEDKELNVPGYKSLGAMARGHYWPGEGDQLAVMVSAGKEVGQLVIDLQSGSYKYDQIPGAEKKGIIKIDRLLGR